jgi:hypothetical protein
MLLSVTSPGKSVFDSLFLIFDESDNKGGGGRQQASLNVFLGSGAMNFELNRNILRVELQKVVFFRTSFMNGP